MLFGALGDNGNDVRDIFVSTRYRSELWKMWGGKEVGGWETWRRTGVGRGECEELLFGAIGDNGNDVWDLRTRGSDFGSFLPRNAL